MTFRTETIGDCTLIQGDCLEVLPTLGKVDAVVTDPPFNIPVKYQAADKSWPRSWGDHMAMEPWVREWLSLLSERIHHTGQVYVCCDENSYPIFYKAGLPLFPRSHMLIWYKPTGRRGAGWMHSYELIAHFAFPSTEYAAGFRQDVIGIMPVRTLNREHPAQKPGELVEFIADAFPETYETILDPFMGSGTTLVACAKLGRKGIGIEIEPKYFDIACKRVEDAYRQPRLDLPEPTQPQQEAMAL